MSYWCQCIGRELGEGTSSLCCRPKYRQPTLEDISMFVQDSWIYAALISLPEGDSIIIMKRKVDRDKTCYGNCTDTCQICDDNIVFNRSKASIKPMLGMMVPGKPYILSDDHFEGIQYFVRWTARSVRCLCRYP
uniref:Uncharacterized protein LOC111133650 n=1 Tax=Crassostrea virginica TaxID=6565 RepID=A0A8B8EE95_CRAVI|nr:uncharacterized protein LOC111133650 [Crassostrea virginica]